MDEINNIPRLMRFMRLDLQWTQHDLDKFLGLALNTIQRYEQTNYSQVSYKRIVEIYNKLKNYYEQETGNKINISKTYQNQENLSVNQNPNLIKL